MASTRVSRNEVDPQGNRKTFTLSQWIKRTKLGVEGAIFTHRYTNAYYFHIRFNTDDTLKIQEYSNSSQTLNLQTNRKFRDTNAWYHIVVTMDTTQATDSNRMKLYVNGVQETSLAAVSYPSQNLDLIIDGGAGYASHYGDRGDGGMYFDGLISHANYTQGTAYDASAFGSTDSTTGEWKINTSPSVTYGSKGYFIFKDGNSVTDQSGNSNNFSVGAGTFTKTEDNPSNVFATWNPLQATTSASYTFEAGNTRIAVNDVDMSCGATLGAKTGKFYMEMKWVQQGGNDRWGIQPVNSNVNQHVRTNGVGWDQSSNQFYMLGSTVSGSWGGSIGTSDIIQLAMDLDNGALYLGVNGTWRNSGSPTSGSSKTGAVDFSGTSLFGKFLTFAVGKGNNGTSGWNANFGNGYIEQTAVSSAGTNASGNGIFEYDVPTGYTALSTKGINS